MPLHHRPPTLSLPIRTSLTPPTTKPSRLNLSKLSRSRTISSITRPIPPPTPFCKDVPTFLTLIGRSLSQHASKFPTWASLFQTSSRTLRASGIEPARSRRYLLWWRERYRRGEYGIGGDCTLVSPEGIAELRAVEVERGMGGVGGKRVVVNTRVGESEERVRRELEEVDAGEIPAGGGEGEKEVKGRRRWVFRGREVGVKGVQVGEKGVVGSRVEPVGGTLGSVARLKIQEGLWEVRRGHKVHGGERRRKYVLSVLRRKEREERERVAGGAK